MSSSSARPYYPTLDSLRGICAVLVALFHLRANSHFELLPLVRNGWLFVDFFFVLSGFVIAENYRGRLSTGEVTIRRFIWLRLARLYPLHLFMLLMFIATEYALSAVHAAMRSGVREPFTGSRSLDLLPENLLLLQSFGFSGMLSWNGPAWSISAEFWTYCLFALLFAAGALSRAAWFALCLAGAPLAIFALHGPSIALEADGGILRCLFGFGAGVLLSRLRWPQSLPQSVCTYGELPVALLMLAFVNYAPGWDLTLAAPMIFAAVVTVFAQGSGPLSRHLGGEIFLFLGMLSYSIYMVHIYVHARFKNAGVLAEKFTGVPLFLDAERALFGATLWAGDIFVAAMLITTIAVSFATWKLIEKPGQAVMLGVNKKSSRTVSRGSSN
ncbi:acyltransferase (plasmid) [Leisingera caerulea]|uniref:Acyltransferase n=1 Tax=Leisingera caerulea TaxID=506591 RepID=A0ABY5X420_LEICA|nr:acyltransferase [Leisingera caerulea]UWQ61088.1 acyltransferase [Leisingera caerulea]UWQ64769.1 acyltransferase [Leisingera caerulea]